MIFVSTVAMLAGKHVGDTVRPFNMPQQIMDELGLTAADLGEVWELDTVQDLVYVR